MEETLEPGKLTIVAMSDLHGMIPTFGIPNGDVLVIAGDICPDRPTGKGGFFPDPMGQAEWLDETFEPWFRTLPHPHKLITWGNHDFSARNEKWRGKVCVEETIVIKGVKFWLSPWSPQYGSWAWMKDEAGLAKVYAQIPSDADVIVSHAPAHGLCVRSPNGYRGPGYG